MKKPSRHFYEFDTFRVDVADRRLLRNDTAVPLTPKVFDILLILVENCGRTVGKDELMESVWADSFVEEGNLNRNVSTLRKLLDDDALKPKFIRTSPKLGYCFVGDVQEIWEDEEAIVVENRTRYHLAIREEKQKTVFSPLIRLGFAAVTAAFVISVVGIVVWDRTQANYARSGTASEERRSPEAFELYRKGRALWETRSGQDLHEGTMLLEQAVKLDPELAVAHAALADAYAFDYTNWKKAASAAGEAIRIDSGLAEPHASIGFVKLFWEWKLREAEAEFKQAIQLNPDYATAHQWYAELLIATDRRHAAFAEMELALKLEPRSTAVNAGMCQILYLLGRYGEAEAQCKRTLDLNPNVYSAHLNLYRIYSATGSFDQAVEHYIAATAASGDARYTPDIDRLRTAYRDSGISGFRQTLIDVYNSGSQPANYRVAQVYAEMGDRESALRALEDSYARHEFEFLTFYADPVFEKLRGDPRYEELIGRLHPVD